SSSRRVEARRKRRPTLASRHVGQHASAAGHGVYSQLGRHAFSGAEKEEIKTPTPTVSTIPVELASQRKIRERNKLYYRINHWPIWIFVFFIAPGPLTFDLFAQGFDRRMALWLTIVLTATAFAGLRGRLPGVEPTPYT